MASDPHDWPPTTLLLGEALKFKWPRSEYPVGFELQVQKWYDRNDVNALGLMATPNWWRGVTVAGKLDGAWRDFDTDNDTNLEWPNKLYFPPWAKQVTPFVYISWITGPAAGFDVRWKVGSNTGAALAISGSTTPSELREFDRIDAESLSILGTVQDVQLEWRSTDSNLISIATWIGWNPAAPAWNFLGWPTELA